jgi:hypothetical protein
MKTPLGRIMLFVLVFVCVITLPWWISAVVLAGLTIYLSFYLEILFFGFLIDTLYLPGHNFPWNALTFAFVFLLGTMLVKKRIRT